MCDKMPHELYDLYFQSFIRSRGVDTPCPVCNGLGTMSYGDTSTWRHKSGGHLLTVDVCDCCWGSGDANRRGADLRAMEAKIKELENKVDNLKDEIYENLEVMDNSE